MATRRTIPIATLPIARRARPLRPWVLATMKDCAEPLAKARRAPSPGDDRGALRTQRRARYSVAEAASQARSIGALRHVGRATLTGGVQHRGDPRVKAELHGQHRGRPEGGFRVFRTVNGNHHVTVEVQPVELDVWPQPRPAVRWSGQATPRKRCRQSPRSCRVRRLPSRATRCRPQPGGRRMVLATVPRSSSAVTFIAGAVMRSPAARAFNTPSRAPRSIRWSERRSRSPARRRHAPSASPRHRTALQEGPAPVVGTTIRSNIMFTSTLIVACRRRSTGTNDPFVGGGRQRRNQDLATRRARPA